MGRLIDVDSLIRELTSGSGESTVIHIPKGANTKDIIDAAIQAYRKVLFATIDEQPNAYDVDKVVEQLKDMTIEELGITDGQFHRCPTIQRGKKAPEVASPGLSFCAYG